MTSKLLNFRCPEELRDQVLLRGDFSGACRTMLTRYVEMVSILEDEIRQKLSENELNVIHAVSHGVNDIEGLYQRLIIAQRSDVADNVSNLTSLQQLALLDLCERQ